MDSYLERQSEDMEASLTSPGDVMVREQAEIATPVKDETTTKASRSSPSTEVTEATFSASPTSNRTTPESKQNNWVGVGNFDVEATPQRCGHHSREEDDNDDEAHSGSFAASADTPDLMDRFHHMYDDWSVQDSAASSRLTMGSAAEHFARIHMAEETFEPPFDIGLVDRRLKRAKAKHKVEFSSAVSLPAPSSASGNLRGKRSGSYFDEMSSAYSMGASTITTRQSIASDSISVFDRLYEDAKDLVKNKGTSPRNSALSVAVSLDHHMMRKANMKRHSRSTAHQLASSKRNSVFERLYHNERRYRPRPRSPTGNLAGGDGRALSSALERRLNYRTPQDIRRQRQREQRRGPASSGSQATDQAKNTVFERLYRRESRPNRLWREPKQRPLTRGKSGRKTKERVDRQMEVVHASATHIQRYWRGCRARKYVDVRHGTERRFLEIQKLYVNQVALVRCLPRWQNVRDTASDDDSVKACVGHDPIQSEAAADVKVLDNIATYIQAIWRAYRERNAFLAKKHSARFIQAFCRARRARMQKSIDHEPRGNVAGEAIRTRIILEKRDERSFPNSVGGHLPGKLKSEKEKATDAAAASLIRFEVSRPAFNDAPVEIVSEDYGPYANDAAVVIQRTLRSFKARIVVERVEYAIPKVQALWRMYVLHRKYRNEYATMRLVRALERTDAADQAHTLWREISTEGEEFDHRRRRVTVIQAWWRGCRARDQLLDEVSSWHAAATVLQSLWRGFRIRLFLYELFSLQKRGTGHQLSRDHTATVVKPMPSQVQHTAFDWKQDLRESLIGNDLLVDNGVFLEDCAEEEVSVIDVPADVFTEPLSGEKIASIERDDAFDLSSTSIAAAKTSSILFGNADGVYETNSEIHAAEREPDTTRLGPIMKPGASTTLRNLEAEDESTLGDEHVKSTRSENSPSSVSRKLGEQGEPTSSFHTQFVRDSDNHGEASYFAERLNQRSSVMNLSAQMNVKATPSEAETPQDASPDDVYIDENSASGDRKADTDLKVALRNMGGVPSPESGASSSAAAEDTIKALLPQEDSCESDDNEVDAGSSLPLETKRNSVSCIYSSSDTRTTDAAVVPHCLAKQSDKAGTGVDFTTTPAICVKNSPLFLEKTSGAEEAERAAVHTAEAGVSFEDRVDSARLTAQETVETRENRPETSGSSEDGEEVEDAVKTGASVHTKQPSISQVEVENGTALEIMHCADAVPSTEPRPCDQHPEELRKTSRAREVALSVSGGKAGVVETRAIAVNSGKELTRVCQHPNTNKVKRTTDPVAASSVKTDSLEVSCGVIEPTVTFAAEAREKPLSTNQKSEAAQQSIVAMQENRISLAMKDEAETTSVMKASDKKSADVEPSLHSESTARSFTLDFESQVNCAIVAAMATSTAQHLVERKSSEAQTGSAEEKDGTDITGLLDYRAVPPSRTKSAVLDQTGGAGAADCAVGSTRTIPVGPDSDENRSGVIASTESERGAAPSTTTAIEPETAFSRKDSSDQRVSFVASSVNKDTQLPPEQKSHEGPWAIHAVGRKDSPLRSERDLVPVVSSELEEDIVDSKVQESVSGAISLDPPSDLRQWPETATLRNIGVNIDRVEPSEALATDSTFPKAAQPLNKTSPLMEISEEAQLVSAAMVGETSVGSLGVADSLADSSAGEKIQLVPFSLVAEQSVPNIRIGTENDSIRSLHPILKSARDSDRNQEVVAVLHRETPHGQNQGEEVLVPESDAERCVTKILIPYSTREPIASSQASDTNTGARFVGRDGLEIAAFGPGQTFSQNKDESVVESTPALVTSRHASDKMRRGCSDTIQQGSAAVWIDARSASDAVLTNHSAPEEADETPIAESFAKVSETMIGSASVRKIPYVAGNSPVEDTQDTQASLESTQYAATNNASKDTNTDVAFPIAASPDGKDQSPDEHESESAVHYLVRKHSSAEATRTTGRVVGVNLLDSSSELGTTGRSSNFVQAEENAAVCLRSPGREAKSPIENYPVFEPSSDEEVLTSSSNTKAGPEAANAPIQNMEVSADMDAGEDATTPKIMNQTVRSEVGPAADTVSAERKSDNPHPETALDYQREGLSAFEDIMNYSLEEKVPGSTAAVQSSAGVTDEVQLEGDAGCLIAPEPTQPIVSNQFVNDRKEKGAIVDKNSIADEKIAVEEERDESYAFWQTRIATIPVAVEKDSFSIVEYTSEQNPSAEAASTDADQIEGSVRPRPKKTLQNKTMASAAKKGAKEPIITFSQDVHHPNNARKHPVPPTSAHIGGKDLFMRSIQQVQSDPSTSTTDQGHSPDCLPSGEATRQPREIGPLATSAPIALKQKGADLELRLAAAHGVSQDNKICPTAETVSQDGPTTDLPQQIGLLTTDDKILGTEIASFNGQLVAPRATPERSHEQDDVAMHMVTTDGSACVGDAVSNSSLPGSLDSAVSSNKTALPTASHEAFIDEDGDAILDDTHPSPGDDVSLALDQYPRSDMSTRLVDSDKVAAQHSSSLERAAACVLQAAARDYCTRTHLQTKNSATTMIQRCFKEFISRGQREQQQASAVRLQAFARGREARQRLHAQNSAAIAIQSWWRSRKVDWKEHDAVSVLQSVARSQNVRQHQAAAIVLQAAVREMLARRKLESQDAAVTVIQSWWRGVSIQQQKAAAATLLQAHARKWRAQNKLRKQHSAAIMIQRESRKFLTELALAEELSASNDVLVDCVSNNSPVEKPGAQKGAVKKKKKRGLAKLFSSLGCICGSAPEGADESDLPP